MSRSGHTAAQAPRTAAHDAALTLQSLRYPPINPLGRPMPARAEYHGEMPSVDQPPPALPLLLDDEVSRAPLPLVPPGCPRFCPLYAPRPPEVDACPGVGVQHESELW